MPARGTPRPRRRRAARATRHLVCGFASPAAIEQHGAMQLVKGRGVYVWDGDGRKYLDGLASLWNVTVGHGRPEIRACRGRADAPHRVRADAPGLLVGAGGAAGGAHRAAGAEGPDAGGVHLRRLRSQRNGDSPGAALLAPAAASRQDQDRRLESRLPRLVDRRRQPHRLAVLPQVLRAAAAQGSCAWRGRSATAASST